MKNHFATIVMLTFSSGTVLANPLSQVEAQFSGQTLHFHDESHGNQIEYYAPDGTLFLWYTKNRRTVEGEWTVRRSEKCDVGSDGFLKCSTTNEIEICYKYPTSSRNPVTGQKGGAYECEAARHAQMAALAKRDGDIFALSENKKVPFRLNKKYHSINDLIIEFEGKK